MESVFLFCFAFGALFVVASTVLGTLVADVDVPGAELRAHGGAEQPISHGGGLWSHVLNPSALLGGLTAFGAIGYITLHYWHWLSLLALGVASVGGVVGHGVLAAMYRYLQQDAGRMLLQNYDLQGVQAVVTVGIATEGVGEIVFTIAGARRSEAARSLDGQPIAKGAEVSILAFERGVATVELTTRLLGDANVG